MCQRLPTVLYLCYENMKNYVDILISDRVNVYLEANSKFPAIYDFFF